MATLMEWFAGILAVTILLKLVMYKFASDKKLSSMATSMIGNKSINLFFLVLAAVLSWLVIGTIGIINFAAAFLAIAAFYGYVLLSFPKEMKALTKTIVKKRATAWPAWIYAAVLSLWVLWTLFF